MKFSIKKQLIITLICAFSLSYHSSVVAQTIKGYVFVDENGNQIKDTSEIGLENVMVSNQSDVILTDKNGFFEIKAIEGNFVFITKPAGYQFNLDEFNNPKFYFYYKTKKIKENFMYKVSKPVKRTPEILYFPVHSTENEDKHSCLLIGDPQMADDEKLTFYYNGVLPFLLAKKADFYVELGDIADNNLEILAKEKEITGKLGIPGYRIFGNHDVNFKASNNTNSQETFKSVYGPDYYSFDYGNFHYVVLNNIIYPGWNKELNQPGKYTCELTKEQLKWVEKDLSLISAEKAIILLSHAPFHPAIINMENLKSFYQILKPYKRIFAVSGHLHTINAYDYSFKHGWNGTKQFEGLVAGAACGSWWIGPLDEASIPFSTCTDGSPKGFFQLFTNKDDYNYVFHPVNYPSDFQMRVSINGDELNVNWFVGKTTDNVRAFFDSSKEAFTLENYRGKDPFMESIVDQGKDKQNWLTRIGDTFHLWKIKLPGNLKKGYHSVKIVATDSKGKTFEAFKVFQINKK